MERHFGLVGKSLSHSFSKKYFENKFELEKLIDCAYTNFELNTIHEIKDILSESLKGFNVTIPYKEEIIPFLDSIDPIAKEIGAVNTVKIEKDNDQYILRGYNTDAFGFKKAIRPFLRGHHNRALILGTGGASKAIAFVLKELHISYNFISRTPQNDNEFAWKGINEMMLKYHPLIINTTPLGMFPNEDQFPDLPYAFINDSHFVIDLIYNPEKTAFLKKCEDRGAIILNGMSMLKYQAERSWEIWNK